MWSAAKRSFKRLLDEDDVENENGEARPIDGDVDEEANTAVGRRRKTREP